MPVVRNFWLRIHPRKTFGTHCFLNIFSCTSRFPGLVVLVFLPFKSENVRKNMGQKFISLSPVATSILIRQCSMIMLPPILFSFHPILFSVLQQQVKHFHEDDISSYIFPCIMIEAHIRHGRQTLPTGKSFVRNMDP